MQFLPGGGRSGKHRHMWEEVVFVAEGRGYDLHWDLKFECLDAFAVGLGGRAEDGRMVARRFHLHPALLDPPALQPRSQGGGAARRHPNRIVRAMGFDWLDQIENAPGF